MILQPIAMRMPTADGIHAPSRLKPIKEMAESKFLKLYADSARAIQVSFDADGVSDPRPITAYAFGLDGWYIEGVD